MVSGGALGPVVQAGSIDHVSLAAWRPDHLRVPRQLPLAVRDFIGRVEHLAALDALLTRDEDGGRGAVMISALDGTPGVGKTALAVRWAHSVQHRFPGGTLYVNLRGYDPGAPADPRDVLGGFLGAFGVPPEQIPSGLEARAGLYRSVLAGRRVLVVLDNANSAGQVRPLLPGDPGCLVVVTSRAGVAAARRLGDRTAECRLMENLALLHGSVGEPHEADHAMRAALTLAREIDDQQLVAEVLHHLGWLFIDQKRFAEARDHLLAALPHSIGEQDGRMEYLVECHLGVAYSGLGDHDRARRHIERSLALLRQTDVGYEPYMLTRLAQTRQSAGDHDEAIALCEQALDHEHDHYPTRPQDHAATLDTLGTSLRHAGDTARAIESWRTALAIFDKFGDHRATDLRERLSGLETA